MKTKALALLMLGVILQVTSSGTATAAGSNRLWIVSDDTEMWEATIWNRTGDMILVEPGTYTDVDTSGIDPGVTLLSAGGANVTIFRRSGRTEHRFNQDDVVVDGFTFESTDAIETVRVFGDRVKIRNSRFKPAPGEYGLRLNSAADFLIEGSVFDQGDGISIHSGTSAGEHVFRNNEFSNLQQGIGSGSNPDLQVRIENNIFENVNRAIDISNIQQVTIQNNVLADIGHRGIDIDDITQQSSLLHNVFYRNAQAIAVCDVSILVYDSIFQDNTKSIDGCSRGMVHVHHDLIWLGTWLWAGPTYTVDQATIWRDVHNPQFVDPATYDFHLAPTSEARGLGTGGSDLGAYGGTQGSAWTPVPGSPQAPPTLLDIRLEGQLELSVGETVELVAEGDFENGFYAVLTKKATWTSSSEAVLRPLGDGLFEALAPGTVEVIASYGGVSQAMQVTVLAVVTDLTLVKGDSPDPVAPGNPLTYTLTVTNLGPSSSSGGEVTDVLPAELGFASSADGCSEASGTVTCAFGPLAVGGLASLSFVATVDPAAVGPIISTAAVTGHESDPDLGNNTATASTAVDAPCFALTLDHIGSGADPEPSVSVAGCATGSYRAGEVIALTALPSSGWIVGSWTGSDADSSTSATNTVTMPANAFTVWVNYVEDVQPCFLLTLDRSGLGTTPMPNPMNSPDCPEGEFHPGESVELTAIPDSGWTVGSWSGTADDLNIHLATMITMPGAAHLVVVEYVSCVAQRGLPLGYAAERPVSVVIGAAPVDTVAVYAVEDAPPAGWPVTDIDNSGIFDLSTGTVKWGPFFDNQARTLSYWVTPPVGTTESWDFEGVVSTDGDGVLICGDTLLDPASFHPADVGDDWGLQINDITAYGSAWKTGSPWPRPPAEIPINLVTNAGFLWKIGETYHFDPDLNPPWAPGPASSMRRGDDPGGAVMDTAVSTFHPPEYTPGAGVEVTIAVVPDIATQVYALEDEPPAGWAISGISDSGTFDAVNGLVKWGPFFDSLVRDLVYVATPPSTESGVHTFAGQASFDGACVPIIGDRMIADQDTATGTAVSTFDPSQYTPGVGLEVTIAVVPDIATQVHALEDGPPAGWNISEISDGGTFDAVNGLVKWGPYFDNLDRDLVYVATPPPGESGPHSFSGRASFDGSSFPVTGDRTIDHSCIFAIAPSSQSFGFEGGSDTVNVTAPSGCFWDAQSNVEWLTIDSGDTGSGDGLVSYTVAVNSSGTSRSGTLTIAGHTFSVTQGGMSCSFAIDPASATFPTAGGTGPVAVTSPEGCPWTATSSVAWVSVDSGSSGSGSGTVSYTVLPNSSSGSRTGTLTIAGHTFSVTQGGVSCSFAIDPTSGTFPAEGGTGPVAVTSPEGCPWTATSNVGWVSVESGSSGSGTGTVSYSVSPDMSSEARTGTLTIAGQTFTVTQRARDRVGVFRAPERLFLTDNDGSGTFTPPADQICQLGIVGDLSITGDWNGDGHDELGVYRPSTRQFLMDYNGDCAWDFRPGGDLACVFFGLDGIPLVGDWNGDGDDDIGIYLDRLFRLDLDESCSWTLATDQVYLFGLQGDEPITGDWNGDGDDDIGIYRPSNRLFLMDRDESGTWTPPGDQGCLFGLLGDKPIIGDWNADGDDDIGIYRPANRLFLMDRDENCQWSFEHDLWAIIGLMRDLPMIGQW